ncbi:MAG: helix-turn-helix domain-containing protein [Pedobacter sp.]|nr:helix-turn-helix domain-containing protein [Pedobacter sp.]
MELHNGQIVERIIRRNGHSISELARLTKVNRRSVYNWFNQRHLKPEIIFRIGCVLNYDFSSEFPNLFSKDEFIRQHAPDPMDMLPKMKTAHGNVTDWKDKYIDLLEKYNQLLLVCMENKAS